MSLEVKEEGDEEVLVVCEESNEATDAPVIVAVPELEPEVPAEVRPVIATTPSVITSTTSAAPTSSNNRVRPNRRRRGARKNEKNRKSSEEESAPINRYVKTYSDPSFNRPSILPLFPFSVMSGNTFLKRLSNQTMKVGKPLVKTEVTSWFRPCQALLKS